MAVIGSFWRDGGDWRCGGLRVLRGRRFSGRADREHTVGSDQPRGALALFGVVGQWGAAHVQSTSPPPEVGNLTPLPGLSC